MWQSARLTMSERIDCRSEYQILQLLKKKGFPLVGTVYLKADHDNYDFKSWYDPRNRDAVFEWRKKTNGA